MTGDTTTPGILPTDFRTIAPDSSTAPTIHMTNGSKGEGIAGTPRYIYQHGAAIGAPGGNGSRCLSSWESLIRRSASVPYCALQVR